MTTAQIQALRDALYTQYLAWIQAGCPQAYSINGKSKQNVDAGFWLKQINELDEMLAVADGTGGGNVLVQFGETTSGT